MGRYLRDQGWVCGGGYAGGGDGGVYVVPKVDTAVWKVV